MFDRNSLTNRILTLVQMIWNRRRGISIFVLSLAIGTWCLLRFTASLNVLIAAIVSRESGAVCVVKNARWDGWGHLAVESLEVLAPTWPGQTAQLLRVDQVMIQFQPWQLLRGKIVLQEIHVNAAVVNIAERANAHGIFNLMAIQPRPGSGGSPVEVLRASLDQLEVARFTVDANEKVNLEGRHSFEGSMTPTGNSNTEFEFDLTEIPEKNPSKNPNRSDLKLVGSFNQNTFEYSMSITGLSFVESLLPMLPYSVENVWKQINLTGSITQIRLGGNPERPIDRATLTLNNVQATIQIPGDQTEWVRYEPKKLPPLPDNIKTASDVKDPPRLQTGFPRMQVESGTIEFEKDTLKFENFIGKLDSTTPRSLAVPIELDLKITLPPQDQTAFTDDTQEWFKEVFQKSGVEATVKIKKFALTPDNEKDFDGVELPKSAVQVLGNLLAKTWDIDLVVNIMRAGSKMNADGTATPQALTTKGTLNIRGASGGYFLFPYLLSDVNAEIKLNNDTVSIVSLRGKGSGGAIVNITGSVTEPGDDAGVDLRITAQDLPVDEALKKSFLFGPKKVFELLYDHAAHKNLIAAGLLKPNEFQFMGRCDVDLRVERAVKGGANVMTTGAVVLRDANVICSRFPYPVHVNTGKIILEDTAIRLPVEKWKLTTKSNANVTIGGVVHIPRDGEDRKVFPDLTITFDKDSVNPLLLAAIPFETKKNAPPIAGWPGANLSPAARMLQQINLQGALNGEGKIGALADESTTWDFDLFLDKGSITPRASAKDNDADQILPDGFDLENVKAQVNVTDKATSLISMKGFSGDGEVDARGFATLDARERWFQATAKNVPIGRWIFGFLPADTRDDSMLTWGDCNPKGTINADVHLLEKQGQSTRRRVLVDPSRVIFDLDPGLATIEIPCGYFELIDDSIQVHDMRLEFNDMNANVGSMTANGQVNFGETNKNTSDSIALNARFLFADPVFFKVLPSTLQQRLEKNNFQSEGPFEITNGKFTMPPNYAGADFCADLSINDAQLSVGPQLLGIYSHMKLSSDIGGPINGMRLDFEDGELLIQNRAVTQIHGTLLTNSTNGNFSIPNLNGDLYGGRVWLDALVKGEGTRPWQVNVGVAGSNLAQNIAGRTDKTAEQPSDGVFNGMLSLGGEINGDRPREGRGKIHGFNAKLGDLPLALQLLQVTQFMPPLSQTLDQAKIDFYLRDNKIRFEKFDLTCPTLQLLGSGSLDLDTWKVSMRFKNRGTIPIASDVFGAATDLLLAVDVEGSISDPKISATPIPGLGDNPSLENSGNFTPSSTKSATP